MRKNTRTKKQSFLLQPIRIFLLGLIGIVGILAYFLFAGNKPCANSISCITFTSGEFEPNQTKGVFMGKVVSVPDIVSQGIPSQKLLGENNYSNKRISIDLTSQRIYAHEGDTVVYEFLISSGKWYATPTGDFRIWIKLRYTRMKGGSIERGTYYDLPNVPYTMYFYNKEIPKYRGFGIHGAYWHNNFGHPMSHGCINMRPEDAELLYNWAEPVSTSHTTYASNDNPGTLITIYGQPPPY